MTAGRQISRTDKPPGPLCRKTSRRRDRAHLRSNRPEPPAVAGPRDDLGRGPFPGERTSLTLPWPAMKIDLNLYDQVALFNRHGIAIDALTCDLLERREDEWHIETTWVLLELDLEDAVRELLVDLEDRHIHGRAVHADVVLATEWANRNGYLPTGWKS